MKPLVSPLAHAAALQTLCEPVSVDKPCGDSLEYDNEYAVLQARLSPRADVQYGSFSSKPETPDWLEIERDARRLLSKSKDITLLIWLTRARTRMAGASGLLEGLAALQALLHRYPTHIHPQTQIDEQHDPAVRANALAALCDPEGLLEDVRELVVCANTAARLSVRDIERAMSIPRKPYAQDPAHIQRQLSALHAKRDTNLLSLLACAGCVEDIARWATQQLPDDAPDLKPLRKLLAYLASLDESATASTKVQTQVLNTQAQGLASAAPGPTSFAMPHQLGHEQMHAPAQTNNPDDVTRQREQIRQLLGQVRQWIDQHEPSSPVSILLKQAQRMWGKRFCEVAAMIPPELLQAWDKAD